MLSARLNDSDTLVHTCDDFEGPTLNFDSQFRIRFHVVRARSSQEISIAIYFFSRKEQATLDKFIRVQVHLFPDWSNFVCLLE